MFLPFCILSEAGYVYILKHSKGQILEMTYIQPKLVPHTHFLNAWAAEVTEAGYHHSEKYPSLVAAQIIWHSALALGQMQNP